MEEAIISRTEIVVDPASITFAPVEKHVLASPEKEAISKSRSQDFSRSGEEIEDTCPFNDFLLFHSWKGLVVRMTTAANKDKGGKGTSRSSRAGLQFSCFFIFLVVHAKCITNRHGGGRRCLWGQLGSQFGADGSPTCDNTARGKIGAHTAEMQDKCVHGENSSFSYTMQNSDSSISKKGKEIAVAVESVSFNGTYNSVGGNEQSLMSMNNFPLNQNLLIPEGRVHGGGLMAMLRENLMSFEPFAGSNCWFAVSAFCLQLGVNPLLVNVVGMK